MNGHGCTCGRPDEPCRRHYLTLWRRLRREALEVSIGERCATFTPRAGWRDRRACAGLDPDVFYGQGSAGADVCRGCPVRQDCATVTVALEANLPREYVVGYIALPPKVRLRVIAQVSRERVAA